MKTLLGICASSVFLRSVICQPSIPEVTEVLRRIQGTDHLFYRHGQLFFTDSHEHELCAFLESAEQTYCTYIGNRHIAFAVPVANRRNYFVLGYNDRIVSLKWESYTNSAIRRLREVTAIQLLQHENLLYGISDPFGGICFGTLIKSEPPNIGRVFTFHPGHPSRPLVHMEFPGIGLSNSVVWHLNDRRKIYCIDGMSNNIMAFTYDITHRQISEYNGFAFLLDFWAESQQPPLYFGHAMLGRMTIDTRGHLWVPLYGGGHVLQINPITRGVVQAIRIPAVKVSACVFGGGSLQILYASTMACQTDEICPDNDRGGRIFAISNLSNEVRGQVAVPFNLPASFM